MGYNKYGHRPAEFASKSSHSHLIRDKEVRAFLKECKIPSTADDVDPNSGLTIPFTEVSRNPVETFVAIDGGYSEVAVREEFPSSMISFFQFGILFFQRQDLEDLDRTPFIDPDDMAKLKRIQRLKLTLPTRNVTYGGQSSLTDSVRRALYEFFIRDIGGSSLMDTLRWFIFEEYRHGQQRDQWILSSSPYGDESRVPLKRSSLRSDGTWSTKDGPIYLTDVFRLHERVDDEIGAGGIQAYVTTTIEQLLVAHVIRLILNTKPALLNSLMFVKDGPLAFFGQTARLHEPMRNLVNYLFDNHELHLVGLEKSGAFVEHAHVIKEKLQPGTALVLDNDYIYRYIMPSVGEAGSPYGRTTYYSGKVIFKTPAGSLHVVTLPTRQAKVSMAVSDFRNLHVALTNIAKLRCDMYDDALMPVALVNKLVSLSDHPSSRILKQFATGVAGG